MAVAITRTADPASAGTGTTITYSAQSIGTASYDRIVVVCCTTNSSTATPSSATIDYGGGAVAMLATALANTGAAGSRIFYLRVPTGTTADIAVTFAASQAADTQHITVYTVTGTGALLNSNVATGTDIRDTPLTTGPITIPTNGGFIVAASTIGTGLNTWANTTEDLDEALTAYVHTTATRTSALTATAVTCTGSTGNNERGALVWVMFAQGQPAEAIFTGGAATGIAARAIQQFTGGALCAGDSALAVDASVLQGVTAWQDGAILTAAGTLASFANQFVAGLYDETGATGSLALPGSGGYAELEFGLALDETNLLQSDTLDFRIYVNGVPLTNYEVTPRLSVGALARQAASLLAGVGALASAASHRPAGAALLAGAGNVAVDATQTWATNKALLAGAGSLVSAAYHAPGGAALLAGAGSLVSTATHTVAGSVLFAGSGTLASAASHSPAAAALFAGSGTVAVDATVSTGTTTWQAEVRLAGTGTLAAATVQTVAGQALLAGTGDFGAWVLLFDVGAYGKGYVSLYISADGTTEVEYALALQLQDLVDGGILEFKIYIDGKPLNYYVKNPHVKVPPFAFASLAGVGTVAAATTQKWVTNTALLAGEGSLAGDASHVTEGSALFAATGTTAVSAVGAFQGAALISAEGAFAADASVKYGVIEWQDGAVLDGAGTLAVNASHAPRGVGLFAAAASVTVDGVHRSVGAAAFSGAGAVGVDAVHRPTGAVLFAGSGTSAVNAVHQVTGDALFACSSGLVGTANHSPVGSALFAGAGTIAVNGTHNPLGVATLAGAAALTLSAAHTPSASSLLGGVGTLVADATVAGLQQGAALIAADSSLAVDASISHYVADGSALFALDGAIAVDATLAAVNVWQGEALLAGGSGVAVNAVHTPQGIARLSGSGAVAIDATHLPQAVAALSGSGTFVASAIHQPISAALFAGAGQLSGDANVIHIAWDGAALLAGAGSVDADAQVLHAIWDGAALFAGTVALGASAHHAPEAVALFAADSDIAANSQRFTQSAAALVGAGDIFVSGLLTEAAEAWLAGDSELVASARLPFLLSQEHFRFRTDAALVDADPTWGADEDSNDFYPGANTPFRIRISVANSSGTPTENLPWQLMVSKNGGPYTQVTVASVGIRSFDAGASADEADISVQELTDGL